MTKLEWYIMFLTYFWYFEIIFFFRVPIIEPILKFISRWQPWKSNQTPYYCSACWKSYKSEFWFSGFPEFVRQGCHIFLGLRDLISKYLASNGQIINLECPAIRISCAFCLSSLLLNWSVSSVPWLWRSSPSFPFPLHVAHMGAEREREGSCKFYLQPYCAALPLSLSSSSTFAFYRRSNDGMGEKRGKEGTEREGGNRRKRQDRTRLGDGRTQWFTQPPWIQELQSCGGTNIPDNLWRVQST